MRAEAAQRHDRQALATDHVDDLEQPALAPVMRLPTAAELPISLLGSDCWPKGSHKLDTNGHRTLSKADVLVARGSSADKLQFIDSEKLAALTTPSTSSRPEQEDCFLMQAHSERRAETVVESSAPTLDPASLQRYFDTRWGNGAVTLLTLEKFTRGISRETWGITIRSNDGDTARPTALILRRDLEQGSFVPRSLRFEFDVYDRLARTDVPIARPLWYEVDPAWTFDGREFFLREQVEGSWNVPNAINTEPAYDEFRIELSKEMIRKLAMVHAVDWRGVDFGSILEEPADVTDAAPRAIRETYRDLERFQFAPFPVLAEVREWMLDHAPVAPAIVLLKGTNGLGEEVFRDGRIVALSDWEQCSLGDPAQDFARTQDLLPDIVRDGKLIWSMQHALDYYRQLTGVTVSAAHVDYYRLLGCIEGIVAFHNALIPVADGTDPTVRRCYYHVELTHNFQRWLLDAVLGRSVRKDPFGTPEIKEGDAIVSAHD